MKVLFYALNAGPITENQKQQRAIDTIFAARKSSRCRAVI
jgi:hypothetical protein